MASFFPAIGTAYQELTTGRIFDVIAVDEKYGTIEVQYEDGDIAEFDNESWSHLDITKSAATSGGIDRFRDSPFESESQGFYGDPLDIEPDGLDSFDDLF